MRLNSDREGQRLFRWVSVGVCLIYGGRSRQRSKKVQVPAHHLYLGKASCCMSYVLRGPMPSLSFNSGKLFLEGSSYRDTYQRHLHGHLLIFGWWPRFLFPNRPHPCSPISRYVSFVNLNIIQMIFMPVITCDWCAKQEDVDFGVISILCRSAAFSVLNGYLAFIPLSPASRASTEFCGTINADAKRMARALKFG
jgi:hypothetical protein